MKLTQLGSLYKLIRGESRTMRKSVAKQPRQRASAFMLESLENRVLLSATPMDVPTTEPVVTAAVVTTDKPDYAPGETALITTSNTSAEGLKFGDGELVQFQVTRTDGIADAPMGNLPWYVTDGVGGFAAYQDAIVDSNNDGVAESGDRNADGMADWIRPDTDLTVNGSISTNWFVEDQYLGASLLLTATGQASGAVATTAFTDSGQFDYATTLGFASTVSLAAGATNSTALGVDVTAPKNNGSFNVSLSFSMNGAPLIGIGSGAGQINLTSGTKGFVTGMSPGGVSDSETFPITVSVGASVAAGIYHFKATAIESGGTFIGDGGGIGGWAFDVVVSAPAATTTTVLSSSIANTSTYGDSVTFTSTVTSTSTPTGGVNFVVDGGTPISGTAVSSTGTTATWSYTTSALNAGTHTISANYVHTGSFLDSTGSLSGGQVVNKAAATVVVTPYSVDYNGGSHTATVTSITGVNGETGATVGSVDVSNTTHTNAGTYSSDSWSFTGGTNYNNIAATTITDSIAKATASITVNGYTGVFDAAAHGATGSASGVGGVDLSSFLTLGATFTNVPGGTANWSFNAGTNYNTDSGAVNIDITPATASITVNGYTGVFDAAAHGATGSASGVGGVDLSSFLTLGATFTNVPGGTANWSFNAGTNYNTDSGAVNIDITPATASITVNGYTGVFDAAAHGATGSASGVGGVDLSSFLTLGATFTNVPGGTANWSFNAGTNYNTDSGAVNIDITPATASITVNGYTGVFDAAAHGATGSASGVGGVDLSSFLTLGATFTNVPGGTANWSFNAGTNYNTDSGAVNIDITPATASITVNGYTGVFDAAAHGATGSASGVGGVDLSSFLTLGATFTNVPGGTANWSFNAGTNYNTDSGAVNIDITPATASITVNGYTGVFDAAAHGATGSASGVGGVDLSSFLTLGATFTNVPGGTANWSFNAGTNYNTDSGAVNIDITPATASITVNGYTGVFDAAAHGATGSASGVGGVDLSSFLTLGATFTNVPGGTANWSFNAGTNYNTDSGAVNIDITPATASITVNGYTGVFDAAAHGATGSASGVGGVDLSSFLTLGATFTNVPGGTANWSFNAGTNYNTDSGAVNIDITPATASITVNGYTGVFDAAAHGATGSASGVGGVDLSSFLTLGATFTNVPGGTANWSFNAGTNYNTQGGSVAIEIAKANLIANIGSTTKTFGQTINLAGVFGTSVSTGVNGENLGISYTSLGIPMAALVGPYDITGVVADGTGPTAGLLSNYTVTLTNGTLTVTTPSVITTVQDGVNLIIVGTGGCDTITVNATNPSAITVNGAGPYSVGTNGHVIVYGMACDDNISLIGNINLEAHGGDGNDTITGGAGHDVIFGDTGNDTLTGSAGNDVLVGGNGSDRLVGSAGHDILIAGELTGKHNEGTLNEAAYDYATLRAIDDQWAASWSSADLAPDLATPSDDVVDESVDQLTGSSGHDWFIIGTGDKITDINSATKDGDKIS